MGSGYVDPRILDLGTSWRWVVIFTPRPLYPRRKFPRRHNQSGRRGKEKILPLPGDPSVAKPVASRFTDYAILAPVVDIIIIINIIIIMFAPSSSSFQNFPSL
jgi:hypothetical protein